MKSSLELPILEIAFGLMAARLLMEYDGRLESPVLSCAAHAQTSVGSAQSMIAQWTAIF